MDSTAVAHSVWTILGSLPALIGMGIAAVLGFVASRITGRKR